MKKILILIMTLFIIIISCEDFPKGKWALHFSNNSNISIYVYADYILPDTLLPVNKPEFIENEPGGGREIYDSYINDPKLERLQNERLTLFVLSKDLVDNNTWSYIRENNVILKRYEFNWQDYRNMENIIVYP